jgi:hypothetical protein
LATATHARPSRAALSEIAGRAAERAGRSVARWAPRLRSAPGLGGAALVSFAGWDVFHPAGFALAGVFLLLIDRRL